MPSSRNVIHELHDNVGAPASGTLTGSGFDTQGWDGTTCHWWVQMAAAGGSSWDLEGRLSDDYDWVKIVTAVTASGITKDALMLPQMRVVQTAGGATNFQVKTAISEG